MAICKTAAGGYEYRGVRVSDGARLVAAAEQISSDSYVVNNDGVKYTVPPTALSVTANGDTFRTETWTDFHAPASPGASKTANPSGTPASKTNTSATPSTSGTATATASATASAPKTSAAPSSAVPLPPPLAAEVGGGSSEG